MHLLRNELATGLFLLITSGLALPQNTDTATSSPTTTPTSSTSATSTSSDTSTLPSHTDNAGDSNSNDDHNFNGMEHYYFIFLAVILLCVLAAIFMIFRRRHKYQMRSRTSQEYGALQRDVQRRPANGQRHRRNYWRSNEDVGREEGLNEHGEAPPAYMPKSAEEGAPAVPMQTLAREDVGLKPPDYSPPTSEGEQQASGSSPRQTEHQIGS